MYQILFWLPYLVAAAAVIDAVRLRAPWYWYLIILLFPLMGSFAYFAVSRSAQFGAFGSEVSRRAQAKKRLQTLQVQLAHWRGPAVLAEAGEELLALGKTRQAVAHFHEAKDNGAPPEDVNLGLAQALQVQGRYRDAVPLLTELCAAEPDFKLGEAQLALARSLDESGQHERAEKVLRDLLSRRSPFEARVRLARILMKRGVSIEAETLVQEVANDALLLPRYLKRHHGPWIRAARRLKRGVTKLPKPRVHTAPLGTGSQHNVFALAGIGVVLCVAAAIALYIFAVYWSLSGVTGAYQERQEIRADYDALDAAHPSPHGEDLSVADVSEQELRHYLEIRRALGPEVAEIVAFDPTRIDDDNDAEPSWLALFGVFSSQENLYQARNDLDRAVLEELASRDMGPSHFFGLLTIVEWRWLRRDEAMPLGLADYLREDLMRVRTSLQYYEAPDAVFGDSQWEKESERQLARSRAKLADLEQRAGENVELSEITVARLDEHRAELESFEPSELIYWIKALDDTLGWP